MKLRAVIMEDEPGSRETLSRYLQGYCPAVELLGEAATVEEGLGLIAQKQPDLVFLDVEMPFGNAFDLLDRVPDRTFETVFVTAYNSYAMEALNQHAAYYLMKPILIDELIRAVAYVGEIREKEARLESGSLRARANRADGRITLPEQDGFKVLKVSDILYCQADDNYTLVYLRDRKYLVSKTLKYLEDSLAGFSFARIHKSYLVNVDEIVRYKKGKGGTVVLSNGRELSVSASRKKELLAFFE